MERSAAVARRIPRLLHFPLVVLLSTALSTFLYSYTADYVTAEFVSVSRALENWWEVGDLILVRSLELGISWFSNYDGYDVASLTLLSHGPPVYLLATFYEINPRAIAYSLLIDAFTTYIPFRVFRPLSSMPKGQVQVADKDILTSTSIQIYTTILAASIFSVTMHTAYSSYLPVSLVYYFEDIKTMAAAHSATPLTLLPLTLLLGWSAKTLVLDPAAKVGPTQEDVKLRNFDPASASLTETFWYNFCGYTSRTKFILKRTTTLMLMVGANTFAQIYLTIKGVEAFGAIAYSGVYVLSIAITGVAFGLVTAA